VQMMPPPLAGLGMTVGPSGRKHPLPRPFPPRVGIVDVATRPSMASELRNRVTSGAPSSAG
jgi:hypothetical protein